MTTQLAFLLLSSALGTGGITEEPGVPLNPFIGRGHFWATTCSLETFLAMLRDHTGCSGSNPCRPHARQAPSSLYYHSSPLPLNLNLRFCLWEVRKKELLSSRPDSFGFQWHSTCILMPTLAYLGDRQGRSFNQKTCQGFFSVKS